MWVFFLCRLNHPKIRSFVSDQSMVVKVILLSRVFKRVSGVDYHSWVQSSEMIARARIA